MNVNESNILPEQSMSELLEGYEKEYKKWQSGHVHRFLNNSAVLGLRYLVMLLTIILAVVFIWMQFLTAEKVSSWAEWLLGIHDEEMSGGYIAVKKMFSWLVLILTLFLSIFQLLLRNLLKTIRKFDALNGFTREMIRALGRRFGQPTI